MFFDYLGNEVLGLNTTAQNLLGFLNLAELGISSSVAYFLYKPLFDDDKFTIKEIVYLQGWIYKRIALFIVVSACILMCFFPLIFAEITIPIWYAYAIFIVLLCGSLLGYFINYKQIVLTADQKSYKVTIATQGANVFFTFILILTFPKVSCPFLLYLFVTLAGQIFGCLWLGHVIRRDYPWLNEYTGNGRLLIKKYPQVLTKTKQVFVHNISAAVSFNLSPLIMYAFSSLSIIAYYGNYLVITNKVASLLGMVFNSTSAGIGNLIASNDKKRQLTVFWELIDSRLCISFIFLFCVFFLVEPFLVVWLGSKEYLLGKIYAFISVLSSAVFINRATITSFIGGYGLYHDIWAPVAQAITTVSLSLLLGWIYGTVGTIIGPLIAQIIFMGIWKPYFLFSQGFKLSAKTYFIPFSIRCLIVLMCFFVLNYSTSFLSLYEIDTYQSFAYKAVIVFFESSMVVFSLFFVFTKGTRDFMARIYSLLKK